MKDEDKLKDKMWLAKVGAGRIEEQNKRLLEWLSSLNPSA